MLMTGHQHEIVFRDLTLQPPNFGASHVLTKFMDAQRRTALIFVIQGVGCASCMCDWGISVCYQSPHFPAVHTQRDRLITY